MGQWLERYRSMLFATLVVLLTTGVILLQLRQPSRSPIVVTTATPLPTLEATPTAQLLRVYVSGAVQTPDVYELLPDSIVKDALLAAGGPANEADLDRINLAAPVADGQQIYVPHLGEEALPVQPPAAQSAPDGKVHLNTADLATIETLPGIGPSLAQRILDYRQAHGPFERIEDITEVSGIGPATFERIRDLITTE
jgi:competence protein ComEA